MGVTDAAVEAAAQAIRFAMRVGVPDGVYVRSLTPLEVQAGLEAAAPHIEADLRDEVDSLRRQLATAKADALREVADALSREKGSTFADALTIRWLNDRADMAERSGDE